MESSDSLQHIQSIKSSEENIVLHKFVLHENQKNSTFIYIAKVFGSSTSIEEIFMAG